MFYIFLKSFLIFFHKSFLNYKHKGWKKEGGPGVLRDKANTGKRDKQIEMGDKSMFDLIPFDHNEKNLFNYLDDVEKNFFRSLTADVSQFRTDILDKGDHYLLQAELPGFSKEEIKVDMQDNCLTIHAEHKEEKEEKKHSYVRRERKYGSFSRSFDISQINPEGITASYANGILELTLPKKPTPPAQQQKQIEIK